MSSGLNGGAGTGGECWAAQPRGRGIEGQRRTVAANEATTYAHMSPPRSVSTWLTACSTRLSSVMVNASGPTPVSTPTDQPIAVMYNLHLLTPTYTYLPVSTPTDQPIAAMYSANGDAHCCEPVCGFVALAHEGRSRIHVSAGEVKLAAICACATTTQRSADELRWQEMARG